jgi:hypothetical protein
MGIYACALETGAALGTGAEGIRLAAGLGLVATAVGRHAVAIVVALFVDVADAGVIGAVL